MCSKFFKFDDNEIDELLDITNLYPQPNNESQGPLNNGQITSEIATRWTVETAMQTPMHMQNVEAALQTPTRTQNHRANNSDSAVGTEYSSEAKRISESRKSNVQNEYHPVHGYADSAVGTVSQLTRIASLSNQSSLMFINRIDEDFEFPTSPIQPSTTQVKGLALSSQDMFSQCLATPSMDNIYDDRVNQCSNDHQRSANDSFDNFITSLEMTRSSQRVLTNDTSLANHSFYSLMQRSQMMEDLQQPCSSVQLALLTPNVTQFQLDGVQTACSIIDSQNNRYDSQSQVQCSSRSNAPPLIPKSIRDLYEQITSSGLSDWSFVFALSAQTCQELMPMNYAVTLKMSLLLSIASIDTSDDIAPIPIVAVGCDSSSINSIMRYMGNFAQRFFAPTDHTFNVMINSEKVVEIGPVFLAKNGVCYLGDWTGLSKKVADEIKILIDSGRYFFNETSENFQLGTALWTYWSSTQNRKDFSNTAIFIKYFGIPIMTDCNESDDIIQFILLEAKNGKFEIPDDVLNINNEDMKKYLNIARKIKVRKTDEAQLLLKAYSDAIQKDRPGLLSARGFQTIQQMADSFAKLCLRQNVLVRDVLGAISIAEKTFYAITKIERAPLLSPTLDIVEVDQYIEAFHKWIFNYVGMLC